MNRILIVHECLHLASERVGKAEDTHCHLDHKGVRATPILFIRIRRVFFVSEMKQYTY